MIPVGTEDSDFTGELWNKELDTTFILSTNEDRFTTRVVQSVGSNAIVLWQDLNYPYLQVYTPASRDSIALEPMTGPPDCFNSGEGLVVLGPDEQFIGRYGVYLE